MHSSSAVQGFISDWLAAAPGFSVLVELDAKDERCVRIKKFQTWPSDAAGRGEASRALETLCRLADLHAVALCGDTQPYSHREEDAIRLKLWLARFGFGPDEAAADLEFYRPPKPEMHMRAAQA